MRRLRSLIPLLLFAAWAVAVRAQELPLRVHFVDVGQGDAVLIQSPTGQQVVYDAGEDDQRMRDYLRGLGFSQVNLAIASHNHADHIGGLDEVLRRFRPLFFMDNGVPATTRTYARILDAVKDADSQLLEPTERRIALGDVTFTVIPPPGIPAWDQNDNSIGLVVEYGSFRLSLTGDAEPRVWAWWLAHYPQLFSEVQVHKASHHGSIHGDTGAGIAKLSPEVVVVSAGAGNSYGHPDPQALRLYRDHGAKVYRTDEHGTIVVDAQPSGAYALRVERGDGSAPSPGPPSPSPSPAPTPTPTPTPTPAPTPLPTPAQRRVPHRCRARRRCPASTSIRLALRSCSRSFTSVQRARTRSSIYAGSSDSPPSTI